MLAKFLRTTGLLFLAALAIWWGRLLAHSKLPPPEGRWREIPEESLS